MEPLRQIPPVNDVLRSPELAPYSALLGTPMVQRLLDGILAETRRELASATAVIPRHELTKRIARLLADQVAASLQPSLRRVINATGVVLHTNLGRAPLPAAALEHLREVSEGYSNLEFDLARGERGKRDVHVERYIRQLLGCEAAIVVNNNAAAVLLVLNSLGEGGEVIVSRGEQVEIGGSFRIPEVMSRSGARLREVGTTNRTRIADYENAINGETRLLMRVHPSNFRMTGFTERASLAEFVELGRKRAIPSFEDLGSGCLFGPAELGVPEIGDEPVAGDSILAGVDIICFSGDKLLGGPQAGIIAGKAALVAGIRRNPLFRALRVDKLTISVLESILLSYLRGAFDEIPAWRMLRLTASELKIRAEEFSRRAGPAATVLQTSSVVGGGSAPESVLPSWGVSLKIAGLSEIDLEKRLRQSDPPVIARIEDGRLILDLRTVLPEEQEQLLALIARL